MRGDDSNAVFPEVMHLTHAPLVPYSEKARFIPLKI